MGVDDIGDMLKKVYENPILAGIGLSFLIWVLVVGHHEYVHLMDIEKQGVGWSEVCLLGYAKASESYSSEASYAWVRPSDGLNYDNARAWDCPLRAFGVGC